MSRRGRKFTPIELDGRVVEVSIIPLGSPLESDHASGATVLTLTSVADFNDEGGTAEVIDPTDDAAVLAVTYTELDDEDNTLTLSAGIGEDFPADTFLKVTPETVEKWAAVSLDGEDDTVSVRVPHSLYALLEEGVREKADREAVTIRLKKDGSWKITELSGKEPVIESGFVDLQAEDDDTHTLDAGDITDGDAVVTLSHVPMAESVIVRWNGLVQSPTNYTVDGAVLTYTLDGDTELAGDVLDFWYLYREADTPLPVEPDDFDTPWATYVAALNPIQWLRVDETALAGTAAFDSSGFGRGCSYEGFAANVQQIAGATADGNIAHELDGSNSYSYNLASTWVPKPDASFSAAVFYKTAGAGAMCLLSMVPSGTTAASMTLKLYVGDAGAGILSAETWDLTADVVDGATSNDDAWHLGVVTYDVATSTLTLYRDGVAVDSGVQNGTFNTNTRTLQWGVRRISGSTWDRYFVGGLDECLLFDFCLTSTQVSELYASRLFA